MAFMHERSHRLLGNTRMQHSRYILPAFGHYGLTDLLFTRYSDFSRYARERKDGKPNRAQYIQLPFLPIIFTICGVMGIITTSASYIVYGQYYWNPLDIVNEWLANGHAGRAAAFFAALSWYIAQVGTNITANSISAANDMTVLCPKYINIRRGCVIAAIISAWVSGSPQDDRVL